MKHSAFEQILMVLVTDRGAFIDDRDGQLYHADYIARRGEDAMGFHLSPNTVGHAFSKFYLNYETKKIHLAKTTCIVESRTRLYPI